MQSVCVCVCQGGGSFKKIEMQQTLVGKGQKRTHAKRYVTFYSLDYRLRERKKIGRGGQRVREVYLQRGIEEKVDSQNEREGELNKKYKKVFSLMPLISEAQANEFTAFISCSYCLYTYAVVKSVSVSFIKKIIKQGRVID